MFSSTTTDFELEDGFTLSGLNVRLATQTAVTSALPRLPAQTISLLVDVIIKSAARREVALLDVALDHVSPSELRQIGVALLNLIPPRDQAAYAVCVPLFQRASEGDDVPATYTYASMLLRGMGTPADEGRAAQLFARLAKMGQAQSQFILAGLYADGKGVKASYKRAMDLYKQAAEQGVAAAYNPIGVFFRDGQGGIPQDYAQALHYFQKGADLGDPLALVSLAHMYTHGKGVDVDHTRAFELHKQAAEHDVPIAIYNLGTHYFAGKGCPRDHAKAADCFRRAANGGFVYAQINLGNMYRLGLGVEQSDEAAMELYRQAADKSEHARSLLDKLEEEMLAKGKDEGTASKEGGVSGTKDSSGHGEEKAAAEADEAPRKSWFARWFGGDKDK